MMRPPRMFTRTDPRVPYTRIFRSIRARRFGDVVEIVLARLFLDRQPIAFLGCVSGRQAAKVDRGARLVRAVHDRASRRSLWHVNQRVGDAQPFALRLQEPGGKDARHARPPRWTAAIGPGPRALSLPARREGGC